MALPSLQVVTFGFRLRHSCGVLTRKAQGVEYRYERSLGDSGVGTWPPQQGDKGWIFTATFKRSQVLVAGGPGHGGWHRRFVALTYSATPKYESSVTFFVSTPPNADGTALQADQYAQRRVNSYVGLLTSERLAQQIIDTRRSTCPSQP